MADDTQYTDDISALRGPDDEAGLTPAPPVTNGAASHAPAPAPAVANGNGNSSHSSAVERGRREDVARLAEAIASTHVDVVRQGDLDAVRSELEGTFTHQLAVALYELMAASNARFAAAEDSINRRVDEAVERHVTRLTATLDAHHDAATEMSRLIWAEMDSLRQRFIGPVEGLAAFQRELRHEVGRLSDSIAAQGEASERRQDAEAARRQRDDGRLAQAADDMGDVSEALTALREDLGALRAEVAELRAAVESPERQARRYRWRDRNR
jgi:hypothetical protein